MNQLPFEPVVCPRAVGRAREATQLGELIRDPVHGFIELEPYEVRLTKTEPFLRLSRLRQLGLTCYVWPGAEHTRLPHALGAMWLGSRAFDSLAKKGFPGRMGWSEEKTSVWRRTLRAACLLHDLGHPPFSHGTTEVMPARVTHEEMAAQIVETHSEIARCLEQADIQPGAVGDLIRPDGTQAPILLRDLVSGRANVDRMDWLLRDSLYCGVPYGQFDADWLLATLDWCDHPASQDAVLAIEHDGAHAAVGLVVARYFMIVQVYFHAVRRAYDIHLVEAMKHILPSGRYPTDISEFLKWDDDLAWRRLRCASSAGCDHATRVVDRRPYAKVYETPSHPDLGQLWRFHDLAAELRSRFPMVHFVEDRAQDVLSRDPGAPEFYVKQPGGVPKALADFFHLPDIMQGRIFAPEGPELDAVIAFCQDCFSDPTGGTHDGSAC